MHGIYVFSMHAEIILIFLVQVILISMRPLSSISFSPINPRLIRINY